jgi:hypothetical protein
MEDFEPWPEYSAYEDVRWPDVSSRKAKRAIATTTDIEPFMTISAWREERIPAPPQPIRPFIQRRWLMGERHNERRIKRLRSTAPHGFNEDGVRWYTGLLYAAPDDPVYGYDSLVGVVTWVGHIGCLMPRTGHDWRPLVDALRRQSRHSAVPVIAIEERMEVLLPGSRELRQLLDLVTES